MPLSSRAVTSFKHVYPRTYANGSHSQKAADQTRPITTPNSPSCTTCWEYCGLTTAGCVRPPKSPPCLGGVASVRMTGGGRLFKLFYYLRLVITSFTDRAQKAPTRHNRELGAFKTKAVLSELHCRVRHRDRRNSTDADDLGRRKVLCDLDLLYPFANFPELNMFIA